MRSVLPAPKQVQLVDRSGTDAGSPLTTDGYRSITNRSRRWRALPATSLVAGALVLSGCSLPRIADMSPGLAQLDGPSTGAVSRPAPPAAMPRPAPAPVLLPARGDLASGSATHLLAAGERQLAVSYWTDQEPATWTPTTTATIQLSAHLENGDRAHAVKVTRFVAVMDDGTSSTTLADDRGEFVITPPYSYSSGLTIHPTTPTASVAHVRIEFDLLVETSPASGQFFRQTVLDTLTITFAHEEAAR